MTTDHADRLARLRYQVRHWQLLVSDAAVLKLHKLAQERRRHLQELVEQLHATEREASGGQPCRRSP